MSERFVAKSPLGELLIARRAEVIELAATHHATNVRVFGSVASGLDHEDSDIDLVVDFDEYSHPLDLWRWDVRLKNYLEDQSMCVRRVVFESPYAVKFSPRPSRFDTQDARAHLKSKIPPFSSGVESAEAESTSSPLEARL